MIVKTNLFIKKVTRLLFLLVTMLSFVLSASTYYVAMNGSDSNDGTIKHPWKTFEISITKVNAGDTLYFRGGIYYESSVNFQLNGTSSAPVDIQAYANENVEISGGMPDFRDVSTNHWILVDASKNLYKSVQSFVPQDYMNAWLLDDDLRQC